jgi:hypothetical protein
VVAGLALGCRNRDGPRRPGGTMSDVEADRYIRKAVMKSSEGVVLMPATKSAEFDRLRLNEIANAMRQPLAICFLERAIVTMEKGKVDGEETYVKVPEGQAKFRARTGADGSVVRVEVLDSGFTDPEMEACVMKVIGGRKFPALHGQSQSYVDVVYWVSLGFHAGAKTPQYAKLMRKQQAEAGIRAKKCLEGRVEAGVYDVEGLSLFASNGSTLINRITHGDLPADVSRCVAQAFKQIVIDPEKDAFVRPASPKVQFTVRDDGVIEVGDERWLELLQLEERAKREQRRYELTGGEGAGEDEAPPPLESAPGAGFDSSVSGVEPLPDAPAPEPKPESAPQPNSEPKPEPKPPGEDPSKGGIKLDLGPRG